MELENWRATSDLGRRFRELEKLGLDSNVAELDAFGFTIVPPDKSNATSLLDELRNRVSELSAKHNDGIEPDFETGATHSKYVGPGGQALFYLMVEGAVFEAALMNPVVQCLVRYILGDSVLLSSATSTLKGPGRLPFFLHCDQTIHPIPQSLVCNATYLLSDYSPENGGLCFVPGSHRLMRQPLPAENFDFGGIDPRTAMDEAAQDALSNVEIADAPNIVPVTAPAGSIVVWHGNTWHGAFRRTAPGLRVNLVLFFCAPQLRPQEAYREFMPDEILARNDERFAGLMGRNVHFGWTSEGPETAAGVAFERHRRRVAATAVTV